jgi:hypothetical protein
VGIYFERRKRRSLLRHRTALTVSEIYDEFYKSTGFSREIISIVWQEIASCLAVNPSHLRPSDRIDWLNTGRGLPQSDVDDLDVIVRIASRRSGLTPGELTTVDDVVRFLAMSQVAQG